MNKHKKLVTLLTILVLSLTLALPLVAATDHFFTYKSQIGQNTDYVSCTSEMDLDGSYAYSMKTYLQKEISSNNYENIDSWMKYGTALSASETYPTLKSTLTPGNYRCYTEFNCEGVTKTIGSYITVVQ